MNKIPQEFQINSLLIQDTYLVNGELKEWMETGQPYRFFHYIKGYEEGSQKMWWSNGSIRANYVIKNGKRYGLLGLKICSNPYDSVIKK